MISKKQIILVYSFFERKNRENVIAVIILTNVIKLENLVNVIFVHNSRGQIGIFSASKSSEKNTNLILFS